MAQVLVGTDRKRAFASLMAQRVWSLSVFLQKNSAHTGLRGNKGASSKTCMHEEVF